MTNLPSEELENPDRILLKKILTKLEEKEDRSNAVLLSSKWWDVLPPISTYLGNNPNYTRWSDIFATNSIPLDTFLPNANPGGSYVILRTQFGIEGIEFSLRAFGGMILWQKMLWFNEPSRSV